MAGIGLFSALDVAVSGMFVSSLQTQVINHNIANANTPGYSRQFLRIGSQDPLLVTYGAIGRGASALGVGRAQNKFLQQQVVDQTSLLGDYGAMDETLRSVEEVLGGMENDHVRSALNDFFEAWQGLSLDTGSDGAREAVVGATSNLARQFNLIDSSLAGIQSDALTTFDDYVTQANEILQQVGYLNGEIVSSTVGDQKPNDLIDQRQQYLSQLSEYMHFTTVERNDGSIDLIVQGAALVTRSHVNELRVEEETNPDGSSTQFARFGGRNPIDVDFGAGAMLGYQRMANEVIPGMRADLDELAAEIIRRVNDLHGAGVTEDGVGVQLFEGTNAATISINSAVAANNRLVATGSDGSPGDNSIAKAIANLGTDVVSGHDRSIDDIYYTFVGKVANQRGRYDALVTGQEAIVESAQARLDSEKGVNLDEELANLVVYQRAFEANARVIRTVDEMLNVLVNML